MVQPLWKKSMEVPQKKINTELSHHLADPLLGIYQKQIVCLQSGSSGKALPSKHEALSLNPNPAKKRKKIEKQISKRYYHSHVHCSTTHSCQNGKTPKCSATDEWTKNYGP
jgi:hypothetical protein